MAEMSNIDPDFEPQQRPRSGTWPMKRSNIGSLKEDFNDNDISMKLEPTIKEASSQEQLMAEVMMSPCSNIAIKQENQDNFMMSASFSDYGNGLVRSPSTNIVTDYTLGMSSQQPSAVVGDNSNNNLTYANLDSLSQSNSVPAHTFGALSPSTQSSLDIKPNITIQNSTNPSDIQQQINATSSNGDPTTITSPVVTKPKTSSRKNAWGNMSYADLITQGIESSPDKRLTLAQIYDWMVKNVPYFKDKGDSNSSAGWKNSIRHNLSLHSKFKRIQNEGTGKSSWWVINHDAKPGKPSRRRTTSLDTSNPKFNKSRTKALSKKNELLKKQKAVSKRDSPTWTRSPTRADGQTDFEHSLSKSLVSDFRPRTSSNASSIGGRMSPPRSLLPSDLDDDGASPLSPLSSSYTQGGGFELMGRADPAFSLMESLDLTGVNDPLPTPNDLLESIANIDMLNSSSPMTQCSNNIDGTNIYLNSPAPVQDGFTCTSPMFVQQMGNVVVVSTPQQQAAGVANVTTNANRGVMSSPNLASLLQGVSPTNNVKLQALNKNKQQQQNKTVSGVDISTTMPRARANTLPRLQPQPRYNMNESLRRPLNGESLSQESLVYPTYNNTETQQTPSSQNAYINTQYSYRQLQPQQQQQVQNGISSIGNQHKALFQMLGQRRSDGVSSIDQSQQMNINRQQADSTSIASQQRQDNSMQSMQGYPQQTEVQPVQISQQPSLPNDVLAMNEPKYPSDLASIANQDIFDPGMTTDLDQMLQDMDTPPTTDGFGMDFYNYFPQGSSNFDAVDMDNPMDTGNNIGMISSNQSISKVNVTTDSGYTYPSNQVVMETIGVQQQQQQQQCFDQSAPNMYNINMMNNRPSQIILGMETSANSPMVVGGPNGVGVMGGSVIPPHFSNPLGALRPQSSVGGISNYRM